MARFFIEVAHEAEEIACAKAINILLKTGSHFMTHADFGCLDGVHKAWITIDVASKEEAKAILPPEYRSIAKIVQLNKFTLDQIEQMLKGH